MSEFARPRGQQTQTRILERAVQIASVRGLESMSLATLAGAAQMSKSGLFAHFRSKEALQLAIVDEAERMFREAVVAPAQGTTGLARLRRLAGAYVEHMGGTLFDGGSFFAAALHEFDGRPGAVRDRLHTQVTGWEHELRAAFDEARAAKELVASADVERFVFSLTGIGLSLNLQAQTGERERAMSTAHAALQDLLASLAR
jgi:AcrR family transcriptional regulator